MKARPETPILLETPIVEEAFAAKLVEVLNGRQK